MAQCAVMIDFGEPQIFKRHVFEPIEGRIDFRFTGAYLLK
jgi:hypothetical protein